MGESVIPPGKYCTAATHKLAPFGPGQRCTVCGYVTWNVMRSESSRDFFNHILANSQRTGRLRMCVEDIPGVGGAKVDKEWTDEQFQQTQEQAIRDLKDAMDKGRERLYDELRRRAKEHADTQMLKSDWRPPTDEEMRTILNNSGEPIAPKCPVCDTRMVRLAVGPAHVHARKWGCMHCPIGTVEVEDVEAVVVQDEPFKELPPHGDGL